MRSRSKKRQRRTGIYVLPSLFTSASLFGGFYAIIAAIQGRYETAAIAILMSSVFDALDGKIARFTHTSSHFGAEYDSLCDLVAFGVAPAILAFQWALEPFGRLGWLACFMFVICGALRLARFNVQRDYVGSSYFKGLPVPGAASLIAATILFATELDIGPGTQNILIIALMYVLSFLMVSTINYLSFKKFELKKQRPFNVLVSIILFLIVIAYKPKIMLFLILAAYVVSGPLLSISRHKQKVSEAKSPLGDTPQAKKD
ncbi:MAG TPA: CDP-diacylglycerol--serine O-phosphatidyltransferase [Desulfobacteraceae bacterium]|nr:CDP-diacylglycerol--serine O-phosphatidyltransferase [Desulfobacteraceae bacterium]HPJ68247.1 CDP-diacylglycerol--serine O-phosphatidyltransferase [Desulfobacteraceae bacterium]HPQ29129.1 CDP-diacylglycerol--serine O-phosphatidyltransferase [Desulfobacteraceae bacterium]